MAYSQHIELLLVSVFWQKQSGLSCVYEPDFVNDLCKQQ